LRAHALARSGGADEAGRLLNGLPESSPPLCAALAVAEAMAARGEALHAIARLAARRDGDSTALLVLAVARTRLALASGEWALAVAAAREAARVGAAEARGLTSLLVDLLEGARHRQALRAELQRVVQAEPDDVELRFALAYSFDVDHEIEAAAAEYTRIVERLPQHARALVCLAHLRSGADRESCPACERAFAAHPELLDPGAAGDLALRALEAAGRHDGAVLEAGARVALAAGAVERLARWLAAARAAEGGGALVGRLEWWQRRCERAGR
jgi:hypothetical protein